MPGSLLSCSISVVSDGFDVSHCFTVGDVTAANGSTKHGLVFFGLSVGGYPYNTYANLQTSIANWLMRAGDSTITTIVPDLILLFEEEARDRLKTRFNEATTTLSTVDKSDHRDLVLCAITELSEPDKQPNDVVTAVKDVAPPIPIATTDDLSL